MMQRIEADPAFWLGLTAVVGLAFTAAGALLGLLIAWAKAKTAEYEARVAKGTADSALAGQGLQQATLVQHGEAIAALQATSPAVTVSAPTLPVPPAPVLPVPPTAPPEPTVPSAPRPFTSTRESTPPPASGLPSTTQG